MGSQPHEATTRSWHIRLGGRVQGVGFRPFVYRLAHQLGVCGWVQNLGSTVDILAQADTTILERFREQLITAAPPLAQPLLELSQPVEAARCGDFSIRSSTPLESTQPHLPPDYFLCPDCLRELRDGADRRYRYPFINCTQCGPRYTLITALPYDRINTSMAGFTLCPQCRQEYEEPLDRRYHAEPIACPQCGPQLRFVSTAIRSDDTATALRAAVQMLHEGGIVAVKGIGGYHLLCDAQNDAAVTRLRTRKHRPHKPLAVMFPQRGPDGLSVVQRDLHTTTAAATLLCDPQRPIVLCAQRNDSTLAHSIAPGLVEIGAMLPYSPLHHLLLDDFDGPLVATSGNISGEPVLTNNDEVTQRLAAIADAFLHHNRPILRPADDPLWRESAGSLRPLRLGRGTAPLELELPQPITTPTLAVGGHMKNTIALAWDRRVVISPHIGELDTPRSLSVFAQVIADLQQLYGVRAERIVCDAHPDYGSSRWARNSGLPTTPVFHHHAHAAALYGEGRGSGDWLVFTWDGTGLGTDGSLWGGEALLGQPGRWQRVGSLRRFRLPGGDKAGREPWRAAAALCWETATAWNATADTALLHDAWTRGLNSPHSTAAGRLFDAAAALTGLCTHASFEGQGPMLLEANAAADMEGIELPLMDDNDILRIDWSPLLALLMDSTIPLARRAGMFHSTLAAALVAQTQALRQRYTFTTVALGGGVFQNRLLTELTVKALAAAGFETRLNERVPCNDGGLSYGQIIEQLGLQQHRPAEHAGNADLV